MFGPSCNSNFNSFVGDDHHLHHIINFYTVTNNMLTPNPTDTLNPTPNNATTDHNYHFNSPNNNNYFILQYNSPTPNYYYNNNTDDDHDDFSLTHFLAQYQNHHDDQQQQQQQQQQMELNEMMITAGVESPTAKEETKTNKNDQVMKTCNISTAEKNLAEAAPAPPQGRRRRRRRVGGKTDRHSKIQTAQGARDRRMRLSLPIARMFFDLQDTLGFDKASNTIEWLFHKSKSAIKNLLNTTTTLPDDDDYHALLLMMSSSGVSSSEATSEVVENNNRLGCRELGNNKSNSSLSSSGGRGGCASNDPMAAREARDKARARARERTREKMKMMMMMMASTSKCNNTFTTTPTASSVLGSYSRHDQNTYNPIININPTSSLSGFMGYPCYDHHSHIWDDQYY